MGAEKNTKEKEELRNSPSQSEEDTLAKLQLEVENCKRVSFDEVLRSVLWARFSLGEIISLDVPGKTPQSLEVISLLKNPECSRSNFYIALSPSKDFIAYSQDKIYWKITSIAQIISNEAAELMLYAVQNTFGITVTREGVIPTDAQFLSPIAKESLN